MDFGLDLFLRPLRTGDFPHFPTPLPLPLGPPFLLLWLVASIAYCCSSLVPILLLLCCWPGFGMLLHGVLVWRIRGIDCSSFCVGTLWPRCWIRAFFRWHPSLLDRLGYDYVVGMFHFDSLSFPRMWSVLCWLPLVTCVLWLQSWFPF